MIKLHRLCVGFVFISLSIINSSIKAQALDFNFSFTGDQGTNPGTVTGLIQGLKDNVTSTPTDVIIYQNTLGITPGTILNHTGFSQFTVTNGNINFVNGSYYDDNFDHQIYLNLYNSNNMGGNLNGLFNELNQESNYNYNYSDLELGGGTYTPAGIITPIPTTTYYKLSAYGGIAPAPNGKGLEPVKINSILVPFTTSPDSKTIYTNGTPDSLDYVLDTTSDNPTGLATYQDLQDVKNAKSGTTLLTQPLAKSETAQSILDHTSLSPSTVDSPKIQASFSPTGNVVGSVSLGSLAKALGYSGFDWIQEVSQTPVTEDVYSLLPYENLPNNLVDSEGTILTSNGVFNDFLNGGYKGCSIVFFKLRACSTYIADTKPYYFDIPGFGGITGTFPDLLIHESNTSLNFSDTPTLTYVPNSEFTKFTTMLVGLSDTIGDKSVPIINSSGKAFAFNWQSNYDTCHSFLLTIPILYCPTSGNVSLGNNSELDSNSPGSTTDYSSGGVTITDVGQPLQSLPLNILEALSENGVEIPANLLNSQSVPEPSSLRVILIFGVVGVCYVWKCQRSSRAN